MCNPGYTGSGDHCADMNECVQGNGGCGGYAICTNTDGGYFCTCRPGYFGDGYTCSDVDECSGKFGAIYAPNWSAGLDGWVTVNSDMPVGWQISSGKLVYSNPATSNYDSGCANHGTATSPHIDLPTGATPSLMFTLINDTETQSPTTSDLLTVSILHNGVETVVLTKADFPVSGAAASYSLALDPALAGQQIQVRFSFDTVDAKYNGTFGLTVSDFVVNGALNNCDAHATCGNTMGSFTCTCVAPWAGDGVVCTQF